MFQVLKEYASEKYKIDLSVCNRRDLKFIRLRAAIINILYEYFDMTLKQVAAVWGFHHTTVLHHIQQHKYRYIYDVEYADIFDDLKAHAFKHNPSVTGGLESMLEIIDKLQAE